MPTKPKKKPTKSKTLFPLPKQRKLPSGLKGAKVEDIWGKGKDLWKSDEELDEFLDMIQKMKR